MRVSQITAKILFSSVSRKFHPLKITAYTVFVAGWLHEQEQIIRTYLFKLSLGNAHAHNFIAIYKCVLCPSNVHQACVLCLYFQLLEVKINITKESSAT